MSEEFKPVGITYTKEDIAQHYKTAMDSVHLINNPKPLYISDEDWPDTIERNKEHLRIILARTYWTDEDLTPFQDASK